MGKKRISVCTLPNGYELEIEGNKFLCFNEKDLLHGIIYHLALRNWGQSNGRKSWFWRMLPWHGPTMARPSRKS